MARAAEKVRSVGVRIFQILHPAPSERICIRDSDGTIHIEINGDPTESYSASILNFVPGTGGGASISSGILVENPIGSGRFSLDLSVGAVGSNPANGTNNRVIQVSNLTTGDVEGYAFAAVHCGSGSYGVESGSAPVARIAIRIGRFPSLILEVGKIEAGTCDKCDRIGEPTRLIHANDVRFSCSWFSHPIDFCSGDDPAGIWMLEKADARTWKLTLRRKEHIVVLYEFTTKTEKDCSFPLKLRRSGRGGNECKKWPMTVRIEPAP